MRLPSALVPFQIRWKKKAGSPGRILHPQNCESFIRPCGHEARESTRCGNVSHLEWDRVYSYTSRFANSNIFRNFERRQTVGVQKTEAFAVSFNEPGKNRWIRRLLDRTVAGAEPPYRANPGDVQIRPRGFEPLTFGPPISWELKKNQRYEFPPLNIRASGFQSPCPSPRHYALRTHTPKKTLRATSSPPGPHWINPGNVRRCEPHPSP